MSSSSSSSSRPTAAQSGAQHLDPFSLHLLAGQQAAARPRSPAWRGATHYWCPARPRPPPPRRLNVVINQLIVSGSVVPAPGPQSRRCGGMCEVRAGGASLPASRRPARPRPPHQLQQSSVECGVSGEQHLASPSTNTASASAAH